MRHPALRLSARLVAPAGLALLLACGGGSATDSPKTPTLKTTGGFTSTVLTVYSNKLEWSTDGSKVAFEGSANGGSDLYTVSPTAGSTPVKVTNWDNAVIGSGGEAPAYLGTGTLTYYTGWMNNGDDKDMHILAAAVGQVSGTPAPTVYRRFNGSHVGFGTNAASSPDQITFSSDGLRAVATWNGTSWLLDWTSGSVVATNLSSLGPEVALSREGTYLAYRRTTGEVVTRAVAGGAETSVGTGSTLSWAQGGRLGLVTATGYKVVTIGTGASVTYASSEYLQCAALSWDGTQVAWRTFGGASTGISVGTLVNP